MFVDSSLDLVAYWDTFIYILSGAGFLYTAKMERAAVWAGGTLSHGHSFIT